MPGNNRAGQWALDFLRRTMARVGTEQGTRLPSIAALARGARVSTAVMCRAVRSLREAGVLTVRQRAGITLCGTAVVGAAREAPDGRPPAPPRLTWERVLAQLRRDLVEDPRLGSGVGLGSALVCARYHVSPRTARKALTALVQDKVLLRAGRAYRSAWPRRRRGPGTIVLVVRANDMREFFAATPHTLDQLRSLENLCAHAGIALRTSLCCYTGTALEAFAEVRREVANVERNGTLLGAFVWNAGIDTALCATLTHWMLGRRTPVALLNEGAAADAPAIDAGRRLFRLFIVSAHDGPGRRMAEFLARLGHRRVAFIDGSGGQAWAVQRRQTFAAAFAALGGETTAVSPSARPRAELQTRLDPLETLGRLIPGYRRSANSPLSVQDRARYAEALAQREIALLEARRDQIAPDLRRLSADRGISAWVACNDEVAATCLDFCASEGIDVPGRLSICGFDDSDAARLRGITSYNFNTDALISAGFHHIVNRPGASDETGPFTVDGYVVERATSKWAAHPGDGNRPGR